MYICIYILIFLYIQLYKSMYIHMRPVHHILTYMLLNIDIYIYAYVHENIY